VKAYKVSSPPSKESVHCEVQSLSGYWARDTWDIKECPLIEDEKKIDIKGSIHFDTRLSALLNNEIKYFLVYNLKSTVYSASTVWDCKAKLSCLSRFILEHYPQMNSLTDVPRQRFALQYRSFMHENLTKITVRDYMIFYNQLAKFYEQLYDQRNEFEKDIWDVRKMGIEHNDSRSGDYTANFTKVPLPFRELVKRYIKTRLLLQGSVSWSTALQYIMKLARFLNYIHHLHPEWIDLTSLKRTDIEGFMHHLRSNPMGRDKVKMPVTDNLINLCLIYTDTFLSHVQRYEWKEAPVKSVKLLIYPEDKPKLQRKKADKIKYIPDYVWEQILSHISHLPKDTIPMVLLLEATGFRISDICGLKVDCLIKKDDGWLVGCWRSAEGEGKRAPGTCF
jgi:integrase